MGIVYEDEAPQSWSSYLGEAGSDAARSAANAVTFGMADRGLGYVLGTGTDAEVAKSEAARARSPYASIAGDVAGSVAIPGFGAAGLAARMGGRLGARALAYGATGAATGAAQGAGTTYTGKPEDYVNNALVGGALGGVLGAAGGAAFGRGPARSAAATPTEAEQEAAKTIAYRTLEQHPARYAPASFAQRADDIEAALRARNAHEATSPQTFRTIEQMRAPPTMAAAGRADVSPADVDFIRKGVTGDQLAGASPTDQATARAVRERIDDFLRNPPPGAAVPGTGAANAARVADTAHQLNAGFRRTQAMNELISNAERQTGAAASGLNLQNVLRQGVRSGLKEKKGASSFSKAGFNDAELAAFDQFTRGSRTNNALRYVDRVLGGGGGLGATVAAIGAPLAGGGASQYLKDNPYGGAAIGGAAAATGLGLRMIGNRRATADINRMRDLIAQRNPLYAARAARAPMVPGPGSPRVAKTVRDAIATEIIKQRQRPDGADEWE